MEVGIETRPAETVEADWLIAPVFDEDSDADSSLGRALAPHRAKVQRNGDFEAKPFELLPLYETPGVAARRVLLVGLGKRAECDRMRFSRAATAAVRFVREKPCERLLIGLTQKAPEAAAELIAGAVIGSLGCDLHRTTPRRTIHSIRLAAPSTSTKAVERGVILGEAINFARELVDRGPSELFPAAFCERAKAIAEPLGLEVRVFGPVELERQQMRCLLAVGAGSVHPPRLLVVRRRGGSDGPVLGWVGKGITFDSGGLSLKTAEGMKDMKCDMAGGAAVLAATIAAARLNIDASILTVVPLAENMPSGAAYRVGDVLKAKNGKTIEIVNTDAEGRLVLADALCYAVDSGATHLIDVATLTGACVVALGTNVAGVMSNHPRWSEFVQAAAARTGEQVWPLPMFDEYDELIASPVADMKNSGGRWGGAVTAAKLLARFVGTRPWVHVDIAGPSFCEKATPYQDLGGTGCFVRTLVEIAEQQGSLDLS